MESNGKEFKFLNTTCRAQININEASVKLARNVDKMIVVGGSNSSNTRLLYNNVSTITTAFHVESLDDVIKLVENGRLQLGDHIGLTGGASTMMEELYEIKEYLERL